MKLVLLSLLHKLKRLGFTKPSGEKSLLVPSPMEDLPLPTLSFKFSRRSLGHFEGVHPDLVAVMHKALSYSTVDFAITEGLRSVKRQKILMAEGKSKTMRSRHLTGHAVDIMAFTAKGKGTWEWDYYESIAVAVKKAAKELDVMIVWGGDWVSFKDGVHFELNKNFYN